MRKRTQFCTENRLYGQNLCELVKWCAIGAIPRWNSSPVTPTIFIGSEWGEAGLCVNSLSERWERESTAGLVSCNYSEENAYWKILKGIEKSVFLTTLALDFIISDAFLKVYNWLLCCVECIWLSMRAI